VLDFISFTKIGILSKSMGYIVKALQHLSPKYLLDALQFIQFLEYKSINTPDDAFEEEKSLEPMISKTAQIFFLSRRLQQQVGI